MTKNTRTDIHRESYDGFDPQEYRLVHVADTRHDDDMPRIANSLEALETSGFTLGAGSETQCGHCGAHLRYHALLAHDKSQEYIFVGEECLGNRFTLTKEQFADLRRRATAHRKGENISIDTRTAEEREADRQERARKHRKMLDAGMLAAVQREPILAYLMYPEADDFLPPEMLRDVRRFRTAGSGGELHPGARKNIIDYMKAAMARQGERDNPQATTQEKRPLSSLKDNQRTTITATVNSVRDEGITLTDASVDGVLIEGNPRIYVYSSANVAFAVGDKVTVAVTVRHGSRPNVIFGNYPQFIQEGN